MTTKNAFTIETAVKLSPEEVNSIAQALGASPDSAAVEINPLLIAGLRIDINGRVIDLSLKNQLQQLHTKLLES